MSQSVRETRIRSIAFGLAITALSQAGAAKAIMVIRAAEAGTDVVFNYSGQVNPAGLTVVALSYMTTPSVRPNNALTLGPAAGSVDLFSGLSGPSQIGPSATTTNSASGVGDLFGIGFFGSISLPQGYISNTPITGSTTFLNHTFSSLGLTPGTYTWTWGSGANADSAVLTIGSAPSPGPAAAPGPLPLFGAAAAYSWSRRLRRRCGRG